MKPPGHWVAKANTKFHFMALPRTGPDYKVYKNQDSLKQVITFLYIIQASWKKSFIDK